jgi:hypothetical protein
MSHLGGDRGVIGRTLVLDREPYAVVGVMPARFTDSGWAITARDLWVPLAYTNDERAVRENHNAQAIARLKPDVGLERAEAELKAISIRLEREYPKDNAGWGATVIPLREVIVGDIRMSLVMLLGAVGLSHSSSSKGCHQPSSASRPACWRRFSRARLVPAYRAARLDPLAALRAN